MKPTKKQFDEIRKLWTAVAKKNHWHPKKLFVHLWMDGKKVINHIYQVPGINKDTWSKATKEEDF